MKTTGLRGGVKNLINFDTYNTEAFGRGTAYSTPNISFSTYDSTEYLKPYPDKPPFPPPCADMPRNQYRQHSGPPLGTSRLFAGGDHDQGEGGSGPPNPGTQLTPEQRKKMATEENEKRRQKVMELAA